MPSSLLPVLREVSRHYRDSMPGYLYLVILTDNRVATGTVSVASRNMGFDTVVDKVDEHYRITMLRKNP